MADLADDLRPHLKALADELSAKPFAQFIKIEGKYIPRAQARAIERSFWPLVYPRTTHRKVRTL